MKKTIAMLLSMLMLFAMASALAEVTTTEVWADTNSPTGFYVTFRYPGDADRVRLQGQWTFASDIYSSKGTQYYQPEDWKPGYFVDGSFEVIEMAKNEDGVYEYTMPLPNGTFSYWYFIGGEEGAETADTKGATQVFDPALPPMLSEGYDLTTLSAGSNRSHVYVPNDASKLVDDRTFEAPRTDGIGGTILYKSIDVPNGDEVITQPFGIYLPYAFDAEREEPYKVVVLSHGANGDEFNWPNNGCAKNILDNNYGKMEDTVFVFPNNTILKWNLELIHTSVVDYILPYMVENYNVSEAVEDRAFAGLSMGGMTTTYMLMFHGEDFSEYYMMEGSNFGRWTLDDTCNWDGMKDAKIVMLGGYQSFDYSDLYTTRQAWDAHGIDYDYYYVNGGHTWEVWREHLQYVVTEHLWK